MKTINIQPIVKQWIDNNLPTVYAEGSSWYEVLLILTRKVDEMISQINDYFDKDLNQITENILNEWYDSGRLEQLINETLLNTVNDKIDNTGYQVISSGADDSLAIQEAIDLVHNSGGGIVRLPDDVYVYTQDINIKENITLQGAGNTILKCEAVNSKARIIPHDNTVMKDFEIDIPVDYNHSVFYFTNETVMSVDKINKAPPYAKIFIQNVNINSTYSSTAPNKTAVELYATQSGVANALRAGYWGVYIKDCAFMGCTIGFKLHTTLTGWINANHFQDITIYKFKHAVIVDKSPDSLGIDSNVFKLILQITEETDQIFIDNDSSNNYTECQIWDMKSNTNSRVGTTGISGLKNVVNNINRPVERYANYLLRLKYHLIGRFKGFTNGAQYVRIQMASSQNNDTSFLITGQDERVEISINGTKESFTKSIEFYKKPLPNGEVELYMYNKLSQEIFATFTVDAYNSFYVTPMVYYDSVDGLQKLENEVKYYPHIYEKGYNDNGTYIKYTDGTMVCKKTVTVDADTTTQAGSIYISSTKTWEFPENFISSADITLSITGDKSNRWLGVRNVTASEVQYGMFSTLNGTVSMVVRIQAHGRWTT